MEHYDRNQKAGEPRLLKRDDSLFEGYEQDGFHDE